ncbi:MAG: hypothetical protein EU539_03665 [Promethearchaeota archaeon]|nr:MAG: hypothetical protein EU539_03665 [Candidatus Lokiarchaeota archaeon]
MGTKKRAKKKVDIRKKRLKLIKRREKQQPNQDESSEKKKFKTEKEEKLEKRLEKETKMYWVRAITGALSGIIGISIGLTSWGLFFWMLAFWFGLPFIVSFAIFRFEYDQEEWNWKNIIMPGIGIFFFLFMLFAILIYTLQVIP